MVPVHNEEKILPATTAALVERLQRDPGSEVILVENGSTDASPELVLELARDLSTPAVSVFAAESPKGFGHAYRAGLGVASGELIVFTAADLPFGFSDLDHTLVLQPRPAVAVGSKGHPDSRLEIGFIRRLMSAGFSLVRRVLLGLKVKDSQGTILMEGDLARSLLPQLVSGDYLVSTELLVLAAARGHAPVEVPVDYLDPRPDSRIRPLRDSLEMFSGLVRLRRRLGKRS